MDRDQHRRVMDLFDQACTLDPKQRTAFLNEACGEDREVREHVERMLRHDQRATTFVERADGPSGAEFVASGIAALDDEPVLPTQIGQYTIVRKISEGGMGVVYEAIQETPKRSVALKALRPGSASRSLLRRFEFETEVLGRLKHAGIAQIYEAGTVVAPNGVQPFFAMELIHGRQLIDYADAHKLRPRDRLALLAEICDAVHFAHQVGVIHRDLKPGNILVDESAGSKGRPKILDFGIARATDADIRTVTMQTGVGQLVGTIPYMSPEQVSGDPNAVDTRSDVYALGVILFELLGHRLPHDVAHRTIPEAVRVIRDGEPTRLGSVDTSLRGDVETIVAKALEKEKDRRYTSAADLAADIRRFLNDEPIAARPASTFYQLRKFARRNKGLVGGVAVAFTVLIAAVIQTTLERNAARRARDTARIEAARSSALNTFLLEDVFGGIDPYRGADKDLTVARLLDNATSRIDEAFADQPEQEGVVRASLGKLYQRLGQNADAEAQLRKALEIQVDALGPESDDAQETRYKLGGLLIRDGRLEEGGTILRQRLEMQERTGTDDDPDLADTLNELGYLAYVQSQPEEAEALHRRALDIQKRALGDDHSSIATTLDLLANTMHGQRKFDEARALHEECLRRYRIADGDDSVTVSNALFKLGIVARKQRDFESAERYCSEALEMRRRFLQPNHPQIAGILSELCEVKIEQKDLEAAESYCESAKKIQQAALDPNNTSIAKSLTRLAVIARTRGDLAGEEARYREAAAIYRTANPTGSATAITVFLLGRNLTAQDRYAEAVPLLRESLQRGEAVLSENDWRLALIKHYLGRSLAKLDQTEEVEDLLLAAHKGIAAAQGPESNWAQDVVKDLIEFYIAQNRQEDARQWQ